MATPMVIWANSELSYVLRFLYAKDNKTFEIKEDLFAMNGVKVMTIYLIKKWYQLFKSGRTSLKDDA